MTEHKLSSGNLTARGKLQNDEERHHDAPPPLLSTKGRVWTMSLPGIPAHPPQPSPHDKRDALTKRAAS